MKQASAIVFALMMMTVSLAGCFGGDDGDSNDETPNETPTDSLFDWQVHFAASAADLPVCNVDNNGRLYYVEADAEFQVCKTSGWEIIDISGPAGVTGTLGANGTPGMNGQNGADGIQGTAGTDGQNGDDGISVLISVLSSTGCTTGGNTFVIGSDSNADGGLSPTEVSLTLDICNGAQGPAGADGTNGTNGPDGAGGTNGTNGQDGTTGANGQNGADGTNGTNGQDGATGANGQDGATGANGQDGAGGTNGNDGQDGATGADGQDGTNGTNGQDGADGQDGTNGTNGQDGATGADGQDGADGTTGANGQNGAGGTNGNDGQDGATGADGQDGTNGTNGQDGATGADGQDGTNGTNGQDGATGADGQNGADGTNGTNGQDGATGADGTNGTNGLTALVYTSNESSGSNCASGGTRIDVGIDDDGDGFLDVNEIDQTQYICDGSSSNNTMLSSTSSPPLSLGCTVGGIVIFHGLDNGNGNGTPANGQLESGEIDFSVTHCSRFGLGVLKDINVGGSSSLLKDYYGLQFAIMNNNTYFFADDGYYGMELWKTDGSLSGTVMVKDINTGSDGSYPTSGIHQMVVVGSTFYFPADDGSNGIELWKSDGTSSGTTLVKNINSGGSSDPGVITKVGSIIMFSANNGANGKELWKSDGTASGTVLVKDIYSGSNSAFTSSSYKVVLNIGSTFYFSASDGGSGPDLWKSDGTTSGTVKVKDLSIWSDTAFVSIGTTLYFVTGSDYELWKSDGTTSGTVLVKNIHSTGNSFPGPFVVMNSKLYFSAYDGSNGRELWVSDGTSAGTTMLGDFASGSDSTFYGVSVEMVSTGSLIFWEGLDSSSTNGALWVSDGTTSGTKILSTICTNCNPEMQNMIVHGSDVYFIGKTILGEHMLWKSNGTTSGTKMFTDFANNQGHDVSGYCIMNDSNNEDILLFTAEEAYTGRELYYDRVTITDTTYTY